MIGCITYRKSINFEVDPNNNNPNTVEDLQI